MMLSEQKFADMFLKSGLASGYSPKKFGKFRKMLWPHLQRPFDWEAVNKVLKDLIKAVLENAEHMKTDVIMDTLLSVDVIQNCAEKALITLQRLQNGEPCGTCGGSGEKCSLLSSSHPRKTSCDVQPCPDCTEKRYHKSKGGMHLDEREEQQRQNWGRRPLDIRKIFDDCSRGGRRSEERRKCSPLDALR